MRLYKLLDKAVMLPKGNDGTASVETILTSNLHVKPCLALKTHEAVSGSGFNA